MTPEKQRLAIVEFCGYAPCDQWRPFMHDSMIKDDRDCPHDKCYPVGNPPKYDEVLDAMHVAEKSLTDEQLGYYAATLAEMWNGESPIGTDPDGLYDSSCRWSLWCLKTLVKATAAQKSEAFLRTIGKWEDDK